MQAERRCYDFNLTKVLSATKEELPEDLKISLDKIAHEEGYTCYKIFSRTLSTEGGNYMASLFEVDIKGKIDHEEKETNIFIKRAISSEHNSDFDVSDLYCKELFFYTDLSRVFTELEIEAGVPHVERYKSIKAYSGSDSRAIILNNLAKEGFGTIYRMNVMPLKFAELSLQQLAKFHSLSFVIERKRPQYFEKKIKTAKIPFSFNDRFQDLCQKQYRDSTKKLDIELLRKLNKIQPEFAEKYWNYLQGNTKTKCLYHGDFRMNNILMKMTEGEITEVIPVDYQLMSYGSPIVDFIYFIYSASDKEFRNNHFDHLKEIYLTTMENYLKYFEIDMESVYPKKEFEKDYFECLDYALLFAMFLMPLFFTPEDDVPDLGKKDYIDIEVKVVDQYHDRLKEIVEDMIEWGKL